MLILNPKKNQLKNKVLIQFIEIYWIIMVE